MRLEIRKTGEQAPVCDECGATELVWAGGKPTAADLTPVLEREIARRELSLAKVFRAHLAEVAEDFALRETRMTEDLLATLKHERWLLQTELESLLTDAKIMDVPRWRLARHRRERLFAERIDGIVAELIERTLLPMEPDPTRKKDPMPALDWR